MLRTTDSHEPAACARARLLLAVAAFLPLDPAVAAKLTVQIDGVEGDLKNVVTAAADLAQYNGREVTAAQARRLYDHVDEDIAKALEPYGYYHATATGELNETPQGFTAIVHVAPGEPTTVAELAIDVPAPAREQKAVAKALAEFAPGKGQRFEHAAYEKSKANVQAALVASGYLDATPTKKQVVITRGANRAEVALAWDTGRRYRFGATTFTGDFFVEGLIERYVPWHEGDFYAQTQVLQLQQRLIDADYYGIVDVHPDLDAKHDDVVPIVVNLAPAKRDVYTAGIFVDTDYGIGVDGGVTRRWMNRWGHKGKVNVEIAQRLKTAAAVYTIPLQGPNNRALNFGINYRDEDTDTTKSKTTSLVANESRIWMGFTRTLGIRLLTGDFTITDPNGNKALDEQGSSTLLFAEAVLEKKKADDPLFVHDGYSITMVGRGAPGTLVSDTWFAQLRTDGKWIHAFGDNQRLIVRGTLGVERVGNFDDLPPELRFYAGGDRSIRGYVYQGIGVVNANGLVVGGEDLVVASTEYEYYFTPKWGIATFVDTGDAFTGFNTFKVRIGTGLGLRWRSPVGMVRADIGVPVNDPYGKTGPELHLVIGPDL